MRSVSFISYVLSLRDRKRKLLDINFEWLFVGLNFIQGGRLFPQTPPNLVLPLYCDGNYYAYTHSRICDEAIIFFVCAVKIFFYPAVLTIFPTVCRSELPHGSDYFEALLCPLPEHEAGMNVECSVGCDVAGPSCNGEGQLCCLTAPLCRDCVQAIVTNTGSCSYTDDTGDEVTLSAMDTYLDEDDCNICVCVAGAIYCTEVDECESTPMPSNRTDQCQYGEIEVLPFELTPVEQEVGNCKVCVCSSGVLFCITENCGGTQCIYNGERLEVGDSVDALDGCNTCTCFEDGSVGCTEIGCPTPEFCRLSPEVGPCDALFPSWFHNATSRECEMFNYGGCQGNYNRFGTRPECERICRGLESECPDGVSVVDCGDALPCDSERCAGFPTARCVDDNCGECRARFYDSYGEEITQQCRDECEGGMERVFCIRNPCERATCPATPEASCQVDYCGGCRATWTLSNGDDVTERCRESSDYTVNYYAACPSLANSDAYSHGCEDSCNNNCSDRQKCCAIGCNYSCQETVSLPYYDVPLICPAQSLSLSSDSLVCDLECQSDSQCSGDTICCRFGCSSSCQSGQRVREPCSAVRQLLTGNLLDTYVPGCDEEGTFRPLQIWEDFFWCVNVATGLPISSAMRMTANVTAPMCPNCTVGYNVYQVGETFFSDCNTCTCGADGEVECTDRVCLEPCSQPPLAGRCNDRILQFFFNSSSQQCQPFTYSGCGGNENRYYSVRDCLHSCQSDSVCLLEKNVGACADGEEANEEPRYYYNTETSQCEFFLYQGCGGNGNNFQNGLDCLRECDPGNPGPTDIYGNRCWEIQCDIPVCENIVYSEESCCPYCASDVSECAEGEFRCLEDGACVSEEWVCDGLRDCADGSDENCDSNIIHVVSCEFQCSERQCVPESYRCDGALDCDNGMDESECDTGFIGAPYYPPSRVCPDASHIQGSCDESECEFDSDCREGSCCLNNCNQWVCVAPVVELPVCRSVVDRLSSNASYVPQCVDSGDFHSVQCLTVESGDELCWCVNSVTGVPFTDISNDGYPDCIRCSYNGSQYAPGQLYTAFDGCNQCLCEADGGTICTAIRCAPVECVIGDSAVEHGETVGLECLSCTCLYGELNCSRTNCTPSVENPGQTARVEMTFAGGDFDELTEGRGREELSREVLRTLLRRYASTLGLMQTQVTDIELRSGSVIVVVDIRVDVEGANLTVLTSQIQQDFEDGVLIIKFNNTSLRPGEEYEVVFFIEEDEDTGLELVTWHFVVIVVGAVILIGVVFAVLVMLFACCKRSSKISNNGSQGIELKKTPF